jgi:hypothetical protein
LYFFLFKDLPELNIDDLENYLMSIEQQTESHVASPNIQSLTGLSAEEIAEEVDSFFASVNKQQPDSPNIQSLTRLSAEEIAEEVDLFFATNQPIFENEAAISNDGETPEIGESNVGKRPASPQATSSKRHLQECTSEYTSVRKMIFFCASVRPSNSSSFRHTMKSHIFRLLFFFLSDCRLPAANSTNLCQLCCDLPMCTRCRKRLAPTLFGENGLCLTCTQRSTVCRRNYALGGSIVVTNIPTDDASTDIRSFIWQSADMIQDAIQQALNELR